MTESEILRARSDTPACETLLHFNNAGASLMPMPVVDAQIDYLKTEAALGGYEAYDALRSRFERVYDSIGRLLSAPRNQIAIMDSATRAWQAAFYSIPLKKGDRILTGQAEYGSNWLLMSKRAHAVGAAVEVIPNDETGQLSIDQMGRAFSRAGKVKLIAITHIPSNGGLINPVLEVGELARKYEALYLLDGCQSVGQLPIDVSAIGCDFFSATGRKFLRGPRGSGFLYLSERGLKESQPLFIDLHHAKNWKLDGSYEVIEGPAKFENFEMSYASRLALGVACDYVEKIGITQIEARIQHLSSLLREQLRTIPGIRLRDLGTSLCGIVTFTSERMASDLLQKAFFSKRIQTAVSRPEHAKLDMDQRGLNMLLRASVHYYNTETEVARFCEAVEDLTRHTK